MDSRQGGALWWMKYDGDGRATARFSGKGCRRAPLLLRRLTRAHQHAFGVFLVHHCDFRELRISEISFPDSVSKSPV